MSKKKNNDTFDMEIPLGLGMALARNIDALNQFSSLPKNRQKEIIDHTSTINSKAEMREYVDDLAKNQFS